MHYMSQDFVSKLFFCHSRMTGLSAQVSLYTRNLNISESHTKFKKSPKKHNIPHYKIIWMTLNSFYVLLFFGSNITELIIRKQNVFRFHYYRSEYSSCMILMGIERAL